MGKSSRTKARDHVAAEGEVGPRQPCPCGSGRRYKACHGVRRRCRRRRTSAARSRACRRECDVVALRELVPAATAPLTLKDSDRTVQLCSLLPMAAPAMVRDERRDLARPAGPAQLRRPGPRPRRRADQGARRRGRHRRPDRRRPARGRGCRTWSTGTALDVTVHEGFDYWIADVDDKEPHGSRPRAGQRRRPTRRPGWPSVEAAYWTNVGLQGAPALGDARARGPAARRARPAARRGPGRRSPRGRGSSGCSAPTACSPRSGTSRSAPAPRCSRSRPPRSPPTSPRRSPTTSDLTPEQRSARSGLANRQVTIR